MPCKLYASRVKDMELVLILLVKRKYNTTLVDKRDKRNNIMRNQIVAPSTYEYMLNIDRIMVAPR